VKLTLSTNCGKQGKYAWELGFMANFKPVSTWSCGWFCQLVSCFHIPCVYNWILGGKLLVISRIFVKDWRRTKFSGVPVFSINKLVKSCALPYPQVRDFIAGGIYPDTLDIHNC
jgi:hypothetical protein